MVHGEEGHQILKMMDYEFCDQVLFYRFRMRGLGRADLTEAFREDGGAF